MLERGEDGLFRNRTVRTYQAVCCVSTANFRGAWLSSDPRCKQLVIGSNYNGGTTH